MTVDPSNNNFIETRVFGKLPNGETVQEYILRNSSGIELKVLNYGGIIRCLSLPDKNGVFEDVVLGFDDFQGYLDQSFYMGAIIGRYGNRIANGKFKLEKEAYSVVRNNNSNHLHGGIIGFDKVIWDTIPFETENSVGLKMTYRSRDMEEGYPGTLDVTVTYTLTNNDELIFDYEAKSDKKTIINLTNHAYYNITSKFGHILNCLLKINASKYLAIDESQIPIDKTDVEGSPFDFREFKSIATDIDKVNEQLNRGAGYDHCWVLDGGDNGLNYAASLADPVSGRQMDVYTEEPGIQFYSGNFLNAKIPGKTEAQYHPRSGICLETQHFPDSPNRPDFPSVILDPDKTYRTRTLTKFGIRET